ncbi:tRNA (adenosine(37)-N6)-threonylcarbamoyltransferase complex ATPase subunit type 1 TsaE [Candidatus Kaiserbacteria bacterium]|nr:tRNA (adenosine(37)-N6)-threonylcarbamoyltransferase complex ATPase subunit type 1 TsaE [Candidatus Kaiserbacteria bacterium]
MENRIIPDLDSLREFAKEVLDISVNKFTNQAGVIALNGELGAGKTAFVQQIAKELSIAEAITSPTFVIMKMYEIDYGQFKQLIHIDAYRIEEESEMLVLGFGELLEDKENLICIEWADNIKGLLPENQIQLNFELTGNKEERSVNIYGN